MRKNRIKFSSIALFILILGMGFNTGCTSCSRTIEERELDAENGDPYAQFSLGNLYFDGGGVPQNYSKAFYWFKKSADQGHRFSQYNLAQMYSQGQGVSKSYKEAARWWEKSAEQGFVNAQFNLAIAYYYGQGISKNNKMAIYWLAEAIDNGSKEAKIFYRKNFLEKIDF